MMAPMLLNHRYRVIRVLGSGGFGETFLAEDTQMPTKRRCVVKQLKPIANNSQVYQLVQERFQREAAILEELGDGNNQIPTLYAYFCEDGQFYLAQEYIEGQTLAEKLQRQGTLSEASVIEILISILPVLNYVHSKGIVHRDIKPDNILIRNSNQQPVLIDFGAVKETVATVVTASGNSSQSIVIGTPGFMPSEQTAGRPVFSSDLYSLGLTAIYLLTGKYPQELATNPSTGEILWRQYALNITPSFAAILDKAIQPHAPNRYKNVSEMLRSLQNFVTPKIQPNPTLISAAPAGAYVKPQQTPTVVVAPNQAIPYHQPANAQGMNDWQKALVMGGVIGVCVLGGLLIIDRKDNTQQQTTVVQQSTSVAPTTSLPTQEPRLSQPLVSRISAGQALRNYYETINRSEYQSAWSQLSPQHRNNSDLHPAGFNSFTAWWQQVTRVNIQEIVNSTTSNDTAIVEAQVKYIMTSGRQISQSLRYFFVWNTVSERWLIEKVQKI